MALTPSHIISLFNGNPRRPLSLCVFHMPHPLLGSSLLGSMTGEEEVEEPAMNKRASLVNFDLKVSDKSRKSTSINRDPTPFPKELHAKAMQWRAAREIVVGGEGGTEGGVTKRVHVGGKRIQNRNSLLTALANPLDVSAT